MKDHRFDTYEIIYSGFINGEAEKIIKILIQEYNARKIFGQPQKILFPNTKIFPKEYLKHFKKFEPKDD